MAFILRYVDLRVVGFILVYGLAASRWPAVVTSGATLGCERNVQKKERERKRKRKEKEKEKEIKNKKIKFRAFGVRQVELGLA